MVDNDARTGMPPGIPGGAMCVQRFDDSLNSAIHITYRISLRSSSMPEPRDPLLIVLKFIKCFSQKTWFRIKGLSGAVSAVNTEVSRAPEATRGKVDKGLEVGRRSTQSQ